MAKYEHGRGGVYNVNYHIVFCPKYRHEVLVGHVASYCEQIIRESCEKIKVKIQALEIMPDHVHLFVTATPKLAPHKIVRAIKGPSSRILRGAFPHLKKRSTLWSSSYYLGTVGHVSESVVKNYIENQ